MAPSRSCLLLLSFAFAAALAHGEQAVTTVDTASGLFRAAPGPEFSLTQLEDFSQRSYAELFHASPVETFGEKVRNLIELAKAFVENSRFQLKSEKKELAQSLEQAGFLAESVAAYAPNYFVFEAKALRKAVRLLQQQLNLHEDVASELENKLAYCRDGHFLERIDLGRSGDAFLSGVLAAVCHDRRNIELLWTFVSFELRSGLSPADQAIFVAVGTLGLGKVIPCRYEKHSFKYSFPQNELPQQAQPGQTAPK